MAAPKTGFDPACTITAPMAGALMRIESVRQAIETLPITPRVLANLRETSRLFSTHYSTVIEGNRLTQEQVAHVIADAEHIRGRERDEDEVKGYFAALHEVEKIARGRGRISEATIQRLHGLVMGGARTRVKSTPWREGQNIIRDSASRRIVYMPPEARDVGPLMRQLIAWLNEENGLPVPLKAGVAHYRFATIHPFYDGNGRTARLLSTLILHLGGYDLKGIYALEEYYARNLKAYCEALTVGPSHNYYLGRAAADVTGWLTYFIEGMAVAFEKIREQAQREARRGGKDQSKLLRALDPRQRRTLTLFRKSREVAAKDIAALFGYKPRSTALLCRRWVEDGFLEITDPAKKSRRYRLGKIYSPAVE